MLLINKNNNSINTIVRKLSKSIMLFKVKIILNKAIIKILNRII